LTSFSCIFTVQLFQPRIIIGFKIYKIKNNTQAIKTKILTNKTFAHGLPSTLLSLATWCVGLSHVLATGLKVRGFKLGREKCIFKGDKNP
jgi:hypothetical protein